MSLLLSIVNLNIKLVFAVYCLFFLLSVIENNQNIFYKNDLNCTNIEADKK